MEWQNPSKAPNIYECKVESHELFFFFFFVAFLFAKHYIQIWQFVSALFSFSLDMKFHSTLFSFITIQTYLTANSSSNSSLSHRLRFAIQYLRLKWGFILFILLEQILKICTNKNFLGCTRWISLFHYQVLFEVWKL